MNKQQAIARAIDASTVAAQAVNSYGIGDSRTYKALQTASRLADQALALGATRAEIDAEHARRR